MGMAGIFVVVFSETLEKGNGGIALLLTLKAFPVRSILI